ncbi:MAG TPA: 2'-5' RNA ligase family protein [Gemmatimonadaceae bacterium]|nr:2'-5' RNA ligase family protein [Gemmatimonadaceae bacterium]
MATGIFIISELEGELRERVHTIQRRFDPRLAAIAPPHITIAGSSGVGPLPPDFPSEKIRAALEPITETTSPITAEFGPPMRFMQTNIVVLPLSPHGPLRTLHDRIATSGLPFPPARFTFTPHCTLSLYQTLPPEAVRELLAIRIPDPIVIDRLQVYRTNDPLPSRRLLELEFRGGREPARQRVIPVKG